MRNMQAPPQLHAANRTAAEQRAHLARELVETLLFVGLVFFIVHVTVQSFRVQDSSMTPALQSEQSVLVNTKAFFLGGPSRGDVVVYVNPTPGSSSTPIIGRVIAVPGDTISLNATQVVVNGHTLKEPYVKVGVGQAENSVVVTNLKLGTDQYYILADNRTALGVQDSRTFDGGTGDATVPRQNIVGKAVLVFWPLSSLHWVPTYSDAFSAIPSP